MDVTPKLRRNLRLQGTAFLILFLAVVGLLAWLATTYSYEADWTAGNRNSLSPASERLLGRAEGTITLTAYASKRQGLRREIRRFARRYLRSEAADVRLKFVNPATRPQRVRELGIRRDGQIVVGYRGRTEKVDQRSEQAVSQAIQRLLRSGERRIRFLTGHGERSPRGGSGSGLSRLSRALKDTGAAVSTLNLAKTSGVPEETDLLVIAGPRQPLLQAEVEAVRSYVADGGNLLWLPDEGPQASLRPLAEDLGLEFHQGVVVDPRNQLFGIPDPTLVQVTGYPRHAVTRDFSYNTVFPGATGLATAAPEGWKARPILRSTAKTWVESGKLQGEIRFSAEDGDVKGPITLGTALTPAPAGKNGKGSGESKGKTAGKGPSGKKAGSPDKVPEQRVIVVADGDFLANDFLGAGGNRELGLNLFHWLTADEGLISVQAQTAPDTNLRLPRTFALFMPVTFLGILPLALAAAGAIVWLRRRRL